MSKKNLLNEATVRRFMKLANMEPLASPFVGRLSEMNPYGGNKDDEEELQEDDAADDDWGGNKGDESETDPGHVDYEGDEDAAAVEVDADVEVDALEDEGADAPLEPDVAARVEDALAGALEALAAELVTA